MAASRDRLQGAFILDPRLAQRLHQACPDLDDWPRSWHVEHADIAVGQQIVQAITPFLIHLLEPCLAKATIRHHRAGAAGRDDAVWQRRQRAVLFPAGFLADDQPLTRTA